MQAVSENDRASIGHNSGDTSPGEIQRAIAVRNLTRSLNLLRAERSALGDEEKDIKADMKEAGCSPRVVAIAKRAGLAKKQDPLDVLDLAMDIVSGNKCADELAALKDISRRRREISARERAAKEQAIAAGVNLRALTVARSLEALDPTERVEIFDALVEYAHNLNLW